MRNMNKAVSAIAVLVLAFSAGCGKEKKQAQAALDEWGKISQMCEAGRSDEASAAGEKLRDENPVFKEAVYEAVKNEPGYPGAINWCSPMLGGKVLLALMDKIE